MGALIVLQNTKRTVFFFLETPLLMVNVRVRWAMVHFLLLIGLILDGSTRRDHGGLMHSRFDAIRLARAQLNQDKKNLPSNYGCMQ